MTHETHRQETQRDSTPEQAATCEQSEPLVFAMLEEELTRRERALLTKRERAFLNAHLKECTSCRTVLQEERTLNRWLMTEPREVTPRKPRLWFRVAALTLTACLLLFVLEGPLTSEPAYGSIAPAVLTASLEWQDGSASKLGRSNHLEIPAGAAATLELLSLGTLRVTGPAAFELEKTQATWKLVLLRGQVKAHLENESLLVVTAHGSRVLLPGETLITLEPEFIAQDANRDDETPGQLVDQGLHAFFQTEDMARAETLFRRAWNHKKANEDQKRQALFYLSASLSRQGKYEEAVANDKEFLKRYPEDKSRAYVLFFLGVHHDRLGQTKEAHAAWNTLIEEHPESSLVKNARFYLEGNAATGKSSTPTERQPVTDSRTVQLEATHTFKSTYLVVEVHDGASSFDQESLRFVARKARAHHQGVREEWDGKDFAALAKMLQTHEPAYVLFVVPPDVLDVNLHRQILMLSTKLDDDLFPDFAFGYFTAGTGTALKRLWKRTQQVHEKGLENDRWIATAVTSGMRSRTYSGLATATALNAGYEGDRLYFSAIESDEGVMEFVREKLPELERASIITMTGCGDPQGIWLFGDARNGQSEKHWAFDPNKVGQDPAGEMPRILAKHFAALRLRSPVVWSGTCHSAATGRVYVEGDIVSTFGKTERCTPYDLARKESLGLAIVDAGAVALLAPIASNHGMSVSREVDFALMENATLGETIKSTYDDLFLQSRGTLNLQIVTPGEPHSYGAEPIMQGGGANRILIGDPRLRPLRKATHPLEHLEVQARPGGFHVKTTWRAGWHARQWDMYGTDRSRDHGLYVRLPLNDHIDPKQKGSLFVKLARALDERGNPFPATLTLTHAEVETWHGERYLHLQVNGPRKELDRKHLDVEFEVTLKRR